MQGMRGFVGQTMSGQRKALSPLVYVYPANANTSASYTWTATDSGWFRFVGWGPGGGTNAAAGGGGALVIIERPIAAGQSVAVQVGGADAATGSLASTTLTFPTGEVITAGAGGNAGAAGAATVNTGVGDIGISGAAAVGNTGGDAGSSGNYLGGKGSIQNTAGGSAPGGGAGTNSVGITSAKGGEGLVFIVQVRLRP